MKTKSQHAVAIELYDLPLTEKKDDRYAKVISPATITEEDLNDMALMKLIYLAVMNISKKWTQPLQNWALTAGQLRIKFGERMPLTI